MLKFFFGLGPKKKRVEKKRVLYTFFSVESQNRREPCYDILSKEIEHGRVRYRRGP